MSCDYFARYKICRSCGHHEEKLIGCSAVGWPFLIVGSPNFEDWKETVFREDVEIFDEYGKQQDKLEFLKFVLAKQKHFTDPHFTKALRMGAQYEKIVDGWRVQNDSR